MKIRVCYTVEVNDQARAAIGYWWDEQRPATREELKEYFRQQGVENMEDILSNYEGTLAITEESHAEQ